LTVLFALAATFCIGAVLFVPGTCGRDDPAALYFLFVGLVFSALAAFGVGRSLGREMWVALTALVAVPAVLAFVAVAIATVHFAECAN
jgi:hypothetical protein